MDLNSGAASFPLPSGAHTIRRRGFSSSAASSREASSPSPSPTPPLPSSSASSASSSTSSSSSAGSAGGSGAPTFESLRRDLAAFAAARDWDQFHSPRNLVMAMVGEVGELAEIFQWKPDGSCPPGLSGWKDDKLVHLGEEMADVLLYLLRLADRCGIDLPMAAARKLQINGIKYPAEIVLGKSKKYNEYKQDWRSQKRAREEEDQSRSEEPSSKREKLASKPSKKRIIMLGLDGAGKTSILYRLKLGKIVATIPTSGFNVEMVPHKNVEFDIWDVGGAKDKRPLWSGFYENTDAVIFVVDATANEERNAEAEQEIKKVLAAQQLRGVPMLVMSNKQDLVQGKTAENDNVASMPLLSEPSIGAKVRTFQTSAATGEGLDACLDLLAEWTA